MEQFIREIEAYTAAVGTTPQKMLRAVINAQWGQWEKWKDGSSSPTMKIVDRIYAHMAANPPPPEAVTPNEDASNAVT